jgi:hypothetical protein
MDNAQLTITDIISVKNLIEAACGRGTFKAHEMKAIGELYEKLNNFIEASTAQLNSQSQELANQTQGDENA